MTRNYSRDDYRPPLPADVDPNDHDSPLPSEWNKVPDFEQSRGDHLDGWGQTLVNLVFGVGAGNSVLLLAGIIEQEVQDCDGPDGDGLGEQNLWLVGELRRLVHEWKQKTPGIPLQ